MNNPSALPESYFELIEAPSKTLLTFEDSGHGMIWEEADRFHQVMAELATATTE
jgi:pimeloyl-ACP methyl ester carboxylesterase